IILLIAAAVPTSYAAEHSLPGDPLYYLKTEVFEPLEEALTFGAERRAAVTIENAEHRLAETAALVREEDTTDETTITKALLSGKAREARGEIASIKTEDIRQRIELQKDLLTVLEAYDVLFREESGTESVVAQDIADQTDALEEELRVSINVLFLSAGQEGMFEEVAQTVGEIRERIAATTSASGEGSAAALTSEQRVILEHALSVTERELDEQDPVDALEILIFSEQAADVIEKLEDIREAADKLDDDAWENVSPGPGENEGQQRPDDGLPESGVRSVE
ncbi:MAG TPA: DUF5667 domain-containing protein, partial [Candidatus Paceibacterota bacterium]|nr:DUF5667 domain-containing protein [Candidatus Paceibacterota bacterium]